MNAQRPSLIAGTMRKAGRKAIICVLSEPVYFSFFVIFLLAVTLSYRDMIKYFDQSPFDGIFQTLFPLRRMDSGELPGRDFFYFHGNGIPYLLYPLYWLISILSGQLLSASLWSGFFVNLSCLYLPLLLSAGLLLGRRWSWIVVLIVSYLNQLFFTFGFYNCPLFNNALMGVRFVPHLFGIVLLMYFSRRFSVPSSDFGLRGWIYRSKAFIVWAVFLGLGPFFGAEQGIYAMVASALAIFLRVPGWLSKFILSIVCFVISITTFILSQLVFFGNLGTIEAMKIISDNQMWVYGVPPNAFFTDITGVFSLRYQSAWPSQVGTFFSTIAVVWLYVNYRKSCSEVDQAYLTGVLAWYIGGLMSWVSNFGYIGQHQSALLSNLIFFIFVIELVRLTIPRLTRFYTPEKKS